MLVKSAGAFSGFFIGVSLTLIGYVPNAVQSAATVFGLRFLMIGAPVLLIALSAVIYKMYYILNDQFREEVAQAIAQKLKGVS
jgi:melibiose permease